MNSKNGGKKKKMSTNVCCGYFVTSTRYICPALNNSRRPRIIGCRQSTDVLYEKYANRIDNSTRMGRSQRSIVSATRPRHWSRLVINVRRTHKHPAPVVKPFSGFRNGIARKSRSVRFRFNGCRVPFSCV